MSGLATAAPPPGRRLPWGWILTLALVVAGVAGLFFLRSLVRTRDYSKYPAGWTFVYVFQRNPPAGIRELKASGQSDAANAEVWLRFKSTPEDLKQLLPGFQPIPAVAANGGRKWGEVPEDRLVEPQPLQVQWREVTRLEQPEVYVKREKDRTVTLVVDPKTGTAYAHLRGS